VVHKKQKTKAKSRITKAESRKSKAKSRKPNNKSQITKFIKYQTKYKLDEVKRVTNQSHQCSKTFLWVLFGFCSSLVRVLFGKTALSPSKLEDDSNNYRRKPKEV